MSTSEIKKLSSKIKGLKGGVKTDHGKSVSKLNAIKHGVLANTLSEYDKLDVSELYNALSLEFNVKTNYQRILLEELISTYVKLARCSKFQKQKLNQHLHSSNIFSDLSNTVIDNGYKSPISDNYFNGQELIITRYEPQLVSRLIRLITELKTLQTKS